MTTDFTTSIVRILGPTDQTAGTGFVLTDDGLIATCAHVVESAGPGGTVHLIFHHHPDQPFTATVQPNGWRDPEAEDIAILCLDSPLPEGVKPLPLCLAQHAMGHPFKSFGYPELPHEESHISGTIDGLLKQGRVLQISSTKIAPGVSGAPVFDTVTGCVAGIVSGFPSWEDRDRRVIAGDLYDRNKEINYATPTEVLLEIWPDLRPTDIRPYRGLAAFTEADTEFFFGRERLVNKLLARLKNSLHFLAILGLSGSGKSSLVRAGLVPALKQGRIPGSDHWDYVVISPHNNPFHELTRQGLTVEGEDLIGAIEQWQKQHPGYERLVLVIDQFEEIFPPFPAPSRRLFLGQLAELLDQRRPITIILTMRNEFYRHLTETALLPWLEQGIINIPPGLERSELVEIIEKPAAKAGLRFESGLVEQVVEASLEVGQGGDDNVGRNTMLPLLEFTLDQLWARRDQGILTHQAYHKLGGVTGALNQWMEKAFSNLTPEKRKLTQRIFTDLVYLGDEEQGFLISRRRRPLEKLHRRSEERETIERVVRQMTDARLLVTGQQDDEQEYVEIIHDTLLQQWDELRQWVVKDREFILWRQRLDERIHEWRERKGALLHEAALTEAERWLVERSDDLTDEEQIYIRESVNLREHEKRTRERQRQRITAGLAVGLAVVTILALLAWWQRGVALDQTRLAVTAQANADIKRAEAETAQSTAEARRQEADEARAVAETRRQEALARQLAAEAINVADNQYDLALLLSLQANHVTYIPEAKAALLNVLNYNPRLTTFLQYSDDKNGPNTIPHYVAFSPNGQLLATTNCSKPTPDGQCAFSELRLWDVVTSKLIGEPFTIQASLQNLAFSPDGQILAIITNSNQGNYISLWDVKSHEFIDHKLDHNAMDIAFSPNSQILASSGFDKTIRFWDVVTGQPIGQPLIGHNDYVSSLAFSPNGKTLASGSVDGLILLWDVETGQLIGEPLLGHTHLVLSLAFSQDGKRLASADSIIRTTNFEEKGSLIVWDVLTHRPLFHQELGPTAPSKVAFSSGDQRLATSSGNTITLWDLVTQQPIGLPLKGHSQPIYNLASSPDGKTLASTSWIDGKIILWNLSEQPRLGYLLSGHSQWVSKVAFSHDSRTLASASYDHTIKLWDVTTGQLIGQPLVGHKSEVRSLAFSPNIQILASGDSNNSIIFWDVIKRQAVRQLQTSHTGGVANLAFSPDGQILASGSFRNDYSIFLWDIALGQSIGSPLLVDKDFLYYLAEEPLLEGWPGGYLTSLAFGQDSQTLIASGNAGANVMTWNFPNRERKSMVGKFPPLAVTFGSSISPDRTIIATGSSDGTIFLWEIATGKLKGKIHLKDANPVFGIEFNPDGKVLAVATQKLFRGQQESNRGEISLWDVDTLKSLGQLPASHTGDLKTLAFSPNGRFLASGSGDGGIILWDVDFESWQARACRIANRNLTMEEWDQYMGTDTPYQRTCPDLPSGQGAPANAPAPSDNGRVIPTSQVIPQTSITPQNTAVTSGTTIALSPTATSTASVFVGRWRVDPPDLPDGLRSVFPAFVQCRENADSDTLTQEYLGLWAVETTKSNQWQPVGGQAEIILTAESLASTQRYTATLNLGANQIGWLISNQSRKGFAMSTGQPITTVFKLSIRGVDWYPARKMAEQYRYTVDLQSQSTYGNPAYPQHVAVLEVQNLNDSIMKQAHVVGVVQNQEGETVDILSQGVEDDRPAFIASQSIGTDLIPHEKAFFVMQSHSKTGRCVGPADPAGYTLHYWLNFETEDGQPMIHYDTVELPGTEK